MKRLSVKQKLVLWIMSLMLLMSVLVLGFLIAVSNSVVTENARTRVVNTARANLTHISWVEGSLSFDEGFSFSSGGVYTQVYSAAEALLAGQAPLTFPVDVAFQNGVSRQVTAGDDVFFVVDFWLPFDWESGVWVRSMTQLPDMASILDDLGGVVLLLLPLLVILSGVGAYLLARATFRPIDRMISAVGEISEGKDLSKRIGLPPGRDEISRLGQAFDYMFARLETSFEAEKQFTSDASHELRTPTAVILAQCADARRHEQSPEDRQAIDVIERQAKKISDLIAQLLQMTRLEQGTQRICLERANLSELVEVICAEQPNLPNQVTIETEIEPELEATFDVILMSRLLQNLLNNAARYGRTGGHIWVCLRHEAENMVALSVRDDGIGIPAEKLDHIWQRFYQVEPARGEESGAGLGLPMVKQIARLHGGGVTVESIEGVGSVFTLRFPQNLSETDT